MKRMISICSGQYGDLSLEEVCKELDVELLKPEIKYCTDNAAMIGAAGYYAYLRGDIADFSLNPEPGLDLE